ncbi:hypothetical protein BC833DRAFT_582478 [Globomyces pollinis-pini]|nr:hypothetical protein BC833DRAFT_582478 [Globomyces pollinis-pini]
MGQNQSTQAVVTGIANYIEELPDFTYEKSLGNSRFLRTVKCSHPQGPLIVKVYVKSSVQDLGDQQKQLLAERDQLRGIPNVMPYEMIIETERAGYAIRQHLHSSLYDRISTRPFLVQIEKLWISYQLLAALVETHARDFYHGDIKTENVLITSWNWAYLCDFSSYKPVYLPDDNPSNFSLFFDASSRRSCYVAPERFTSPGDHLFQALDGKLTPEMDIFSLGCTIAEIFLEGAPLFTLSQLLRYRKHEYNPKATLEKIENENIRNLIGHMISLNPNDRLSAQEYLMEWRDKAFPECFYSFLHHYIASISDPHFAPNNLNHHVYLSANPNPLVADADARIERLYLDFDRIANVLGVTLKDQCNDLKSANMSTYPVHISIPNFSGCCLDVSQNNSKMDDPALIFCAILCSVVRNCLFPTSKLRALDMLLVLGIQLSDHLKLDRIVPYLVVLLSDTNSNVKIRSLAVLTQLLTMVKTLTAQDASIFPEYILPAVKPFVNDKIVLVRAIYAQSVASLAETALLFLEMAEELKSEANMEVDVENNLYQITYDSNLRDLHDTIQEDVVALLTDSDTYTKRALLVDIPRLCIFFGKQKSNDFLLSHIITYLNDPDWLLRSAFAETIIGVGTFIGAEGLEQFILPLMVMTLTDSEEFVVEKVLNAITALSELGLIYKPKLKELATFIIPLLCHPNRWIQLGAIGFIASICKILPVIDIHCIIYPLVLPFLKSEVLLLDEACLMENLKTPTNRILFDFTLEFAAKQSQSHVSSGIHSDKDADLLTLLKGLGMTIEEREKLFALKHYISKAAKSNLRNRSSTKESVSAKISLREHDVIPHTVFLMPPSESQPGTPNTTTVSIFPNISTEPQSGNRLRRRKNTLPMEQIGSVDDNDSGRNLSRPLSASYLSPGRQMSKSNSVGNFDITSPTSPGLDKAIQRLSGVSIKSVRKSTSVADLTSILDGQERHIRTLLEKKRYELSSPILPDLGMKGKSLNRSRMITSNQRLTSSLSSSETSTWTPKGTLVSHFAEHQGPITAIKTSPNHVFFATASEDGSVKIWDSQRLHTNVTNRSRLTYSSHGSPVKAITFMEGRETLVSASESGQIHISRIEYIPTKTNSNRYTSYRNMRTIICKDDYVTNLGHYDTDNSSLLVFTTKKGILAAWDLRCMKEAWRFDPPAHHGELTSMVVDKYHTWIYTGTHRGVVSLWDTRFRLAAKTWQHPSKGFIRNLERYPITPQGRTSNLIPKSICMSVDNTASEISVWDVETGVCYQLWCVIGDDHSDSQAEVDRLYGAGLKLVADPPKPNLLELSSAISDYSQPKKVSQRAFTVSGPLKCMVSGGNDRKLRYHDLVSPEKSFIISGLASNAHQPQYNSHPFQDIYFNIEHTPSSLYTQNLASQKVSGRHGLLSDSPSTYHEQTKGAELTFSTIPTSHLDTITAISILREPGNMIISGSRDGIIKVFQ